MNSVKIRNIVIGEGRPKICVPIVGITKEEILNQGKSIVSSPVDIIEWRVDWFQNIFSNEAVLEVLKELRDILKEIPLLFTFRTLNEGGEKDIKPEAYKEINKLVASTGMVDLIDVEAFIGEEIAREIIAFAHDKDIKVIASNHDFNKTPSKEEIVKRLCWMQKIGADIPKIALMPRCKKDVLTLLEATLEMSENHKETPIITMSMAGMGVLSRLAGEIFGSAITFGSDGKASAPGQIDVRELYDILEILHESI